MAETITRNCPPPSGPVGGDLLERARAAPSQPLLSTLARRALLTLAARANGGQLEVHESGVVTRLGAGDLVARVTINDPRAFGALLRAGSVGMATSYIAGWWDSDDLTTVVRVLFRWTQRFRSSMDRLGRAGSAIFDRVPTFGAPDRDDDRRNIQAHYDLSNEFFALMLDETMTYSCAIFDGVDTTLRDAQVAKIDRICRKLRLEPGLHVVEIGTGWGGFALHAATRYGCRVTTTTISREQRAEATRRVEAANLSSLVTVLGDDWRDLRGTYDRLVSIEMIEAVDWRRHDEFFNACSRLLGPHGLAAIQAIVIDDRSFERAKRHDDFVRRMVFPGGCIPSVASMTESIRRATDLRIVALDDIGPHYAETLRRWALNLDTHRRDVDALELRPEFRRLWDLYLAYCRGSFLERHISDVQIVLAKPSWSPGLVRPEA